MKMESVKYRYYQNDNNLLQNKYLLKTRSRNGRYQEDSSKDSGMVLDIKSNNI